MALLMFQACRRDELHQVRCIVRSYEDGYWGHQWREGYDGIAAILLLYRRNISPFIHACEGRAARILRFQSRPEHTLCDVNM